MIKVLIKDIQEKEVAGSIFDNLQLAEQWVSEQTANQSVCLWGKLAWTEHVCIEGHIEHNTCESVEHPRNFTIEYIDLGVTLKLEALREQRNTLLAQCDWTQLADAPLSLELKKAWADYRQELRDLPENVQDFDAIVWPTKP